jgi:hypothetical protein
MVRFGFGMPWPRTLRGAWYVLRANQAWAPYPDNDPDKARAYMRRFYALVVLDSDALRIDPVRAFELEVEWWQVHRERQRADNASEAELVDALVNLYAHVYDASPDAVRGAAEHRAVAMRHSDEWVANGCRAEDPLLEQERAELVASYAGLLAAVRH